MNRGKIESIIRNHGYDDFRWISGRDVVVSQWVRFKCIFGCSSYGQKGTCPPSVPSVDDCRKFFDEYSEIAVIHLRKKLESPELRVQWSRKTNLDLQELENTVFKSGYHKAFLLFMDECRICKECMGSREECKVPDQARPGPEALGVDVFATVRKLKFPIEVLTDYKQEMNRYSFLLIE